jgi:flagellar hook protein FlgE
MMRSLFSAVSGLKSNQTAMDIIGNNIANVNTIGYKTSRTVFQDIFSQTIANATAPTATRGGSNPKQVGLGVSISTIGMNMTEGSTQSTSNPLDFAISGEGFFVVSDGNGGYMYTRSGALQLDEQGHLVTANGDFVMGVMQGVDAVTSDFTGDLGTNRLEDGDTIDPDDITAIQLTGTATIDYNGDGTDETLELTDYAIDENGYITALDKTTNTEVTIGRVVLATFNNTGGLQKIGSSYYQVSPNSGDPTINFAGDKCGNLKSGSLEMSNVDLSSELTNMIITQRGFQANSRVITTTDSMLEELINLKR